MKTSFTGLLLVLSLSAFAQPDKKSVVIGKMTHKPNALLIVNPENSNQGALLPQLTTGQRMAMKPSSDEDGLIVFDHNHQAYYYWSKGSWAKIYAVGNDQFCNIDPIDFTGLKPDNEVRHDNIVVFEGDNSFVTASCSGKGEQMIASLNVPHGAELKEISFYYSDNHPNNIGVYLTRKDLTGASEEIVSWESSGTGALIGKQSFTAFKGKEVIDLENYSYRFLIKFDLLDNEQINAPGEARQRVYGLKIRYQQ